jgi:membrane protein implicated in regulation of membrane protease activity
MEYHYWLIVGVILLVAEVLTMAALLIFIGLAALIVSGLTFVGVLNELPLQVVIFSLASIVSIVFLRKHLAAIFGGKSSDESLTPLDDTDLINAKGKVTIAESGALSVVINGTKWDAKGDENLKEGDSVIVTKVDGISLVVEIAK